MTIRSPALVIPVLWLSLGGLGFSSALAAPAAASSTSATKKKKRTHKKPARKSARKTARKTSRRTSRIKPPKAPRVVTASAGTLAALGQAYTLKPTPAGAAALERYAAAHAGTPAEGEASLALVEVATSNWRFDAVPGYTRKIRGLLPQLPDYAAYYEASAQIAHRALEDAHKTLAPVWDQQPSSPFAAPAALMLARGYLQASDATRALAILDEHGGEASPTGVALLRAQALEAKDQPNEASRLYQGIFYDDPLSPEAPAAAQALARLKNLAGHPEPTAQQILGRAGKLLDADQPGTARKFLEDSLNRLSGASREMAQVDIAAALFADGQERQAFERLSTLACTSEEAGAARLYYLVRAASRLERVSDASRAVDELGSKYPASRWRARALIALGNRFLTENDPASYLPLFKACYDSFPDSPDASYCHWKIVWKQYLDDRASAEPLLRAHLTTYPHSPKANAALYFLGRIAESRDAAAEAADWYRAIAARYPNSYYAILARARLKTIQTTGASDPPAVATFLEKLPKPSLPPSMDFEPNSLTKVRIERASLLADAGLNQDAERELKYGASHDGQPQIAALELASLASSGAAVDQAIRYIKHYVPGYLNMPLSAAPAKFWELAFPLPYRAALEQYSSEHALDPYLVAALIRQESEFNPRAVSASKALGLTQVVPSTGKYLSRRAGVVRYRTTLLFQPEVNLKIGTYYLRLLLDSLQGSPEAALASYNAGRSRAELWLSWHAYKEPAEFVETIPFSQTRDYVEIVLHNADIYRRLYKNGGELAVTRLPWSGEGIFWDFFSEHSFIFSESVGH